jgi:16S rRNA (guanine527-N7)-methyltransferase
MDRVSERDLKARVTKTIAKAGFPATAGIVSPLVAYLELLARWNRKINLTALVVDPPNEEALDRLIGEPLCAARLIPTRAQLMIDVGSGGGSPALPIRIARPATRLVMVESKVRKSAFLREAARQLNLRDVTVETCRYEKLLSRPELHDAADLVTLRAVRIDPNILRTSSAFLRPGGRVMLFRSQELATQVPDSMPDMRLVHHDVLLPSTRSYLDILEKG